MMPAIDINQWDRSSLEHFFVLTNIKIAVRMREWENIINKDVGLPERQWSNSATQMRNQFYDYANKNLKEHCRDFKVKVELCPLDQPFYLRLLNTKFNPPNIVKEMSFGKMLSERDRWNSSEYDVNWYPAIFNSLSEAYNTSLANWGLISAFNKEIDPKLMETILKQLSLKVA